LIFRHISMTSTIRLTAARKMLTPLGQPFILAMSADSQEPQFMADVE
jgi:hypothetical protein